MRAEGKARAGVGAGGGRDAGANHRQTYSSRKREAAQPPRHGRIIDGGRIWQKQVRASVHMRRKPFPGWAADVEDVLAAHTLGVEWVRLDDLETGQRYWASVNDFCYRGQLFDYGHGPQLCLPLGEWHVGPTPPEAVGVQLALFGVG